jgi:hypothetical protein
VKTDLSDRGRCRPCSLRRVEPALWLLSYTIVVLGNRLERFPRVLHARALPDELAKQAGRRVGPTLGTQTLVFVCRG